MDGLKSYLDSVGGAAVDDTIGYTVYRCVICDSDIPRLYRTEHNSSAKHKTCLKIAEAVLQRVHGHLSVKDDNEIVKSSPHTYFCAPCTVIVKNTDKIKHEASNDHRKAMLYDRYLKYFLNIYLDKDYMDTDEIQKLQPSHSHEDEDHNLPSCSFDKVNDTASAKDKINIQNVIRANVKNKSAYGVVPNYSTNYANYLSSKSHFDTSTLSVHQTLDDRSRILDKQSTVTEKDDKLFIIAQESIIDGNTHLNVNKNIATKEHLVERSLITEPKLFDNETRPVGDYNHLIKIHNYVDESDQSVEDGNNKSICAQYISSTYQTDSTDKLNQSIDDQQYVIVNSEKTDEKQHLIDDQNKPIADQNNDTTKSNDSAVEYIILVDSNELNVDNRRENEHSHILNESDLEKYLDMISKLNTEGRPSHKLTSINKDYIKIETLDNSTVTVRADNFNGFHLRDGQLQCRVCMVVVDEDPLNHIYNVDHIVHVWQPLEDKHCFRKINDSLKHCVHCNSTFSSSDLHKLLDSHLTALKEAIDRSIPTKPIKPKEVGRIYCEPCKVYIDSDKFNTHKNSKVHIKNQTRLFRRQRCTYKYVSGTSPDKAYCNKCDSFVVTANFTAHVNQHVEREALEGVTQNIKVNDKNKIYCEPCNSKILKNQFRAHLFGKTHKASLKSTNECEGLNKKIYCETCKIYTESLTSHLSGAYHEYHAKRNTKENHFVTPTPSSSTSGASIHHIKFVEMIKTDCKICKIKFTHDAEHTKGQTHVCNYNVLLNTNLLKIINNKFFCGVCEITVVPTKELDHIKSETHKSALSQFRTAKTYCDKCKTYVLTANRSKHLSGEYHKYYLNKTNTPENNDVDVPTPSSLLSDTNTEYQIEITKWTDAICRVCDCRIGRAPDIMEELTLHTKGRAHNANFNELLDKNKVTKIDNKLFCEVCELFIEQSGEFEHFEAKTHKCALAQYNADPTLITPYIQDHEKAFFRLAKGLIDLHDNYERVGNNIDTVTCKICNITVTVEHSKKHLKSATHNSKYISTLNENKIQKVDNKYFCEICSVDILDRMELKHIRSLTHLFEKQLALSTNSCAVCQVLPSGSVE